MKARTPVTLVLCEGKADKLVMESLAKHSGNSGHLVFESYDGESRLRDYLSNLIVRPEYVSGAYAQILVTRDADADYAAAWQSIRDAIHSVFALQVAEPGQWSNTDIGVKISAWIIPGKDESGMIETLCLKAANQQNPGLFLCLDSFIDCLSKQQGAAPHEKVRFAIWTIIAQGSLAKDRLSMDLAVKRIDFNWGDQAYDALRELFAAIDV